MTSEPFSLSLTQCDKTPLVSHHSCPIQRDLFLSLELPHKAKTLHEVLVSLQPPLAALTIALHLPILRGGHRGTWDPSNRKQAQLPGASYSGLRVSRH